MPSPQSSLRVIIAGGGVAGYSTAYALRNIASQITLCEPKAKDSRAGQDYALGLWPLSLEALDRFGCLNELLSEGTFMGDAGYKNVAGHWLAQPSKPLQPYPHGIAQVLFVRESQLLKTLRGAAEGFTSERQSSVESFAISDSGVCVQLSSGEMLEADLLVAANGRSSSLRRQIRGSSGEDPLRYRGYRVSRGMITGKQSLLDYSFQTWGKGMRFAAVPLTDGLVWFATEVCEERDANGTDKWLLLEEFRHWHSPIADIIAATPPETISTEAALGFGLGELLKKRTSLSTGSAGCVAVGDAAHTLDPILAAGAGVAVEDAVALARHLDTSGLGTALAEYDNERRRRVAILGLVSEVSQSVGMLGKEWLVNGRDALMGHLPAAL
ncbi:unnamed protein product, partial [Chrysoparadoxa australica]